MTLEDTLWGLATLIVGLQNESELITRHCNGLCRLHGCSLAATGTKTHAFDLGVERRIFAS